MPVASRQSAGFPIYCSYSGTLPAFTGDNRGSAVALLGSVWALVELWCCPSCSQLFPVPRRLLPVLHGYFRFIPEVLNILILSCWSPGRALIRTWAPPAS
ncbi:hypothetical protein DPMN_001502 [Dreissena polymorpha]|uniref:Uncharacterized protein n=1 Tax=Dreissena polymorpha TaxID=45954 RepID=A0A9D4MHE0_DREPO|nr:hypothetical protein DPMN_001502 [Dreissena polymorpha]